ncbi:MAG TPA: thioredoxin [Euzebyales bacterium]|nr:thioredoxin [Euzebyales bacterium]
MSTVVNAVTEATFGTDVIAASATTPVVVDFWAPWCGPCRQLSPLLEQMAQRFGDDVRVVKLNVDEAPRLAQRFRVQGIPAVKAFRGGRVVSEFVGLQPANVIEQFFTALLPSGADRLVSRATAEPERTEEMLEQAIALEPGHAGALLGLARIAREQGRDEDAQDLLSRVSQHPEAQRLLAEIRLADSNGHALSLDGLARDAERSPQDRLAYARALVAAQQHDRAADVLLAAVADPSTREEARTLLLDLFRVLGDDHEITRRTRPRLASALFA